MRMERTYSVSDLAFLWLKSAGRFRSQTHKRNLHQLERAHRDFTLVWLLLRSTPVLYQKKIHLSVIRDWSSPYRKRQKLTRISIQNPLNANGTGQIIFTEAFNTNGSEKRSCIFMYKSRKGPLTNFRLLL